MPDELAIKLSNLLSHNKVSPVDTREFIFEVRKYLIKDTTINKNLIILFTQESTEKFLKNSFKNSPNSK